MLSVDRRLGGWVKKDSFEKLSWCIVLWWVVLCCVVFCCVALHCITVVYYIPMFTFIFCWAALYRILLSVINSHWTHSMEKPLVMSLRNNITLVSSISTSSRIWWSRNNRGKYHHRLFNLLISLDCRLPWIPNGVLVWVSRMSYVCPHQRGCPGTAINLIEFYVSVMQHLPYMKTQTIIVIFSAWNEIPDMRHVIHTTSSLILSTLSTCKQYHYHYH